MIGSTTDAIVSTGRLRMTEGTTVAHSVLQAESHWYAAYTRAQHEKRVAEQLAERAVEHFLPLYSCVRHWKDRHVRLELPLFPGYVFVRLAQHDRLRVLQIPSVACLVGFGGSPTPLEEAEVEAIRACLKQGIRAEPYLFLTIGRRVRIRTGPLAGFEGVLVRRRGRSRIILSLDLISRSVAVDVDIADLESVPGSVRHGPEKDLRCFPH